MSPRPKQDSIAAAARIDSGLPEPLEQRAVEIAARAYDMSAFETSLLGIITDQHTLTSRDGRYQVRAEAAALAVGNFIRKQGYDFDVVNADMILNAGAGVAAGRVESRQNALNPFRDR